jgi:hypothetical protein
VGCCTVQSRRIWQTFQRCLLPSSSVIYNIYTSTVSFSCLCVSSSLVSRPPLVPVSFSYTRPPLLLISLFNFILVYLHTFHVYSFSLLFIDTVLFSFSLYLFLFNFTYLSLLTSWILSLAHYLIYSLLFLATYILKLLQLEVDQSCYPKSLFRLHIDFFSPSLLFVPLFILPLVCIRFTPTFHHLVRVVSSIPKKPKKAVSWQRMSEIKSRSRSSCRKWDLRFSRRRVWRWLSSGLLRRVV